MLDTSLMIGEKKIFRIGLGTNRIQDDKQSKNALKKAVLLGINFIDTASAYTAGVSEKVIGETLAPYNNILVATKGGMAAPDFHIDSRPEMIAKQLGDSLRKLKVKTIDLYFLHRVDPKVPLKESMLFLKKMQYEGKIRQIGISDVTIDQIKEARKYVDIVAVENEYNLSNRSDDAVINYCEKEKIIFIPFSPLHFHILDEDIWLILQKKYHASPIQLALAWLLKRSSIILPIPGSLSEEHLIQNVESTKIDLTDEEYVMLAATSE